MTGPLIIAILLISLGSHAQAQQPNTAKLKADAQNVVSTIRGDKPKTQAYCQINGLGGQMVEVAQDKDKDRLVLRVTTLL